MLDDLRRLMGKNVGELFVNEGRIKIISTLQLSNYFLHGTLVTWNCDKVHSLSFLDKK